MFWFFKRKPKIDIANLGVIPDPRPPEEKKKDYLAEELFEFAPYEWEEKPEADWHKYPIFNQDRSSSCLAHTVAKALGIENFIEEGKFNFHSAKDIYTQRSNYPGKGMFFSEALKIGYKVGACLEQQMLSQGLNETAMNLKEERTPSMKMIAKILRGGNYLIVPRDIDKLASIIEPAGKPIVLGVRFGPKEWTREVPKILVDKPIYGHGIAGTNATLHQDKKAIVIEDSWGINSGIQGRRIVTEEWFTSGRIIFAGYYMPVKNDGIESKPQYEFKRNLRYGMWNDSDVKKLQECLAWLKMFPSGVIDYTGNFYGITLKAVKLFQETYGIKPVAGYVGRLTRAKLNKLFK